jgi:hypothetical protein
MLKEEIESWAMPPALLLNEFASPVNAHPTRTQSRRPG